MADERLWKPGEIAALLKVDAKTVSRWAASGRMPHVRTLGGHIRVPESVVRAMFSGEHEHRAQYPADTEEAL